MRKFALLMSAVVVLASSALQAADPINDPATGGANSPFLNSQNTQNPNARQFQQGQNPNLRDGAIQGNQNDFRYQSGQGPAPANYQRWNTNQDRAVQQQNGIDVPANGAERQLGYPSDSGYTDYSDPNAPSHVR